MESKQRKVGRDQQARIACAIVWSDKRVGESYYDAAERAVEHIGDKEVGAKAVLEMACIEKADRMVTNRLRQMQNLRMGSGVLRAPTDKELHYLVQHLRAEVGLIDTDPANPLPTPKLLEGVELPVTQRSETRDIENRLFFEEELKNRSDEAKKQRRKS